LLNPLLLRVGLVFLLGAIAFVAGTFIIRRLRKRLVAESESIPQAPFASEGLPVHAYNAVIQQLKQEKHALTTQQLAERRRARASDNLSATVLADLSCGVLFFNRGGLVRQANTAARKLLGFASPVGLDLNDLFRKASVRGLAGEAQAASIRQALAPALSGQSAVRGLLLDYDTCEGRHLVLELTASPVIGEDASLLGTTIVLTDRTEIERIRREEQLHQEVSSEMALGLRNSLATIAGYAQQLAQARDPDVTRQLADDIATEAARLDRTTVIFLAGAKNKQASASV
jgi:PAS domain-containing protein